MSQETLLVTIFFLVPGFFAVQVFRFFLVDEELSTFGLTTWSLIYSVLGIAVLAVVPSTQETVEYLFKPTLVTNPGKAASGVLLQLLVSSLIALLLALFVRKVLGGRVGNRSFYKRGWDYIWTEYGTGSRYVLVQTDKNLYYGTLCFADDAAQSYDIVISNPAKYDSDADGFYYTGMKLMFFPSSVIRSVEVSISNPASESDEPLPGKGYFSAALPSNVMVSE